MREAFAFSRFLYTTTLILKLCVIRLGYHSPTTTSCGAVLIGRRYNTALMFGLIVIDRLPAEWSKEGQGKRQLITESELLPVLIARKLWHDRIAGPKIFVLLDSNPAKYSSIRGTSETQACETISCCISIIDASSMT